LLLRLSSMTDVRSLLKQARQSRRITHPYAKYSNQGVLYCTACLQKIASDPLWESHIASSSHKEKVKDAIRESQRKAKRGIAATAMDEEEEQEPQERKRVKLEAEKAIPEDVEAPIVEEAAEVGGGEEGLPEDFFDEGSKPAKQGVDEDEWMKFQAEITQTIQSQEQKDEDEEEELKRGIVEEFEEMETLEDRVERLKKRRAELQKASKNVKPVSATVEPVDIDNEDDEVEEEEWW